MPTGKRNVLDKISPMGAIMGKRENTKASIRAKVEHPFRVIKRQFGHAKVCYHGLAKNTAQLYTLFGCPTCGWCDPRCGRRCGDACACMRAERRESGRNQR